MLLTLIFTLQVVNLISPKILRGRRGNWNSLGIRVTVMSGAVPPPGNLNLIIEKLGRGLSFSRLSIPEGESKRVEKTGAPL